MSYFVAEAKHLTFPMQKLKTIHISLKNYKLNICEGEGSELELRFHNTSVRRLNIRQSGSSLYLEEENAITFYEVLRLIDLTRDNLLEILIPSGAQPITITAEVNATDIEADDIHAQSIRLKSSTGSIRVRNVCTKYLSADSSGGSVFCLVPGQEDDYDIDVQSGLMAVKPPCFHANRNAERKIVLRSGVNVPELSFTYEPIAAIESAR